MPSACSVEIKEWRARVRSHIRQPKALEGRFPVALAEVLVEQGTTATYPRLRPFLQPAGAGKDAMQLLAFARAADAPREQHLAQRRAHRDFPRSGFRLGHLGQRAVALLDAANADDVVVEVHLAPQQAQLLGRSRAGKERERVVDAVLGIILGVGDEPADVLRRQDRLLRFVAGARQPGRHRRRADREILLGERQDRLQVALGPVRRVGSALLHDGPVPDADHRCGQVGQLDVAEQLDEAGTLRRDAASRCSRRAPASCRSAAAHGWRRSPPPCSPLASRA